MDRRRVPKQKKLFIRFPARIWDKVPPPPSKKRTCTSPLVFPRLAREREVVKQTTNCKTPLYRFIPSCTLKGEHANDIKLIAPCLQIGCKTCTQWHPKIVNQKTRLVQRPAVESFSPILDPRIAVPWNGTEAETKNTEEEEGGQRRENSISIVKLPGPLFSVPQPVDQDRSEIPASKQSQGKDNIQKYEIYLPTSLLKHTVSGTVGANSLWRTEPRKRYTALIEIHTEAGRARLREIVNRNTGKGILEGDNGEKQSIRAAVVGEGDGNLKKIRFRHRVKLVFESGEGQRNFGELIGR